MWADDIKGVVCVGVDNGDAVKGYYTVGCEEDIETGGIDKHMVGTTKVVSFTHNDSAAASQTMALFLQPDTLLQTYLCVSVCVWPIHSDAGLSYCEKHCWRQRGEGALSDFVTSVF